MSNKKQKVLLADWEKNVQACTKALKLVMQAKDLGCLKEKQERSLVESGKWNNCLVAPHLAKAGSSETNRNVSVASSMHSSICNFKEGQ